MSRLIPSRRPLVGLASLFVVAAAVVASGAAPVGAQSGPAASACPSGPPVLQLANPNPGDLLSQGDYIISGVAFDPAATDGSGITRVDLFLGQRDSGGTFLASVTPGQGSPATRGFEVKASLPSTANGGRDFVAYAYSSVTGQETSVSVPVFVGAAPTPTPSSSTAPTPVPLGETTTSTCQASTTVVPPTANGGTSAFQPLPAVGIRVAPVLQLANPSSGDVLPTGDVIIEGVAYDPKSMQGDGVDRVELFLDNRDTGGLNLGGGTPTDAHTFKITATVPSTANGAHTFFAYAHSSVTDQETVTSVPVFIGVAPTPTPRPSN